MNKMPDRSVPQISGALQKVYADVHPLLFPPPQEFTQPLLDAFAAAHDPLLEDNTIFTASMRLREAAIETDSTIRTLQRQSSSKQPELPHLTLEEVSKNRLRARLQSVNLDSLVCRVSQLIFVCEASWTKG